MIGNRDPLRVVRLLTVAWVAVAGVLLSGCSLAEAAMERVIFWQLSRTEAQVAFQVSEAVVDGGFNVGEVDRRTAGPSEWSLVTWNRPEAALTVAPGSGIAGGPAAGSTRPRGSPAGGGTAVAGSGTGLMHCFSVVRSGPGATMMGGTGNCIPPADPSAVFFDIRVDDVGDGSLATSVVAFPRDSRLARFELLQGGSVVTARPASQHGVLLPVHWEPGDAFVEARGLDGSGALVWHYPPDLGEYLRSKAPERLDTTQLDIGSIGGMADPDGVDGDPSHWQVLWWKDAQQYCVGQLHTYQTRPFGHWHSAMSGAQCWPLGGALPSHTTGWIPTFSLGGVGGLVFDPSVVSIRVAYRLELDGPTRHHSTQVGHGRWFTVIPGQRVRVDETTAFDAHGQPVPFRGSEFRWLAEPLPIQAP